MQINNDYINEWLWNDFIFNSMGYIFISFGIFYVLPKSFYKTFCHIKDNGFHEKLKSDHMFKGEKPLLILLFESTLLIVGSYFLIIEGKLFEYLENVSKFLTG